MARPGLYGQSVTLYRIERGEASVTMGAYANAMAALGVQIHIGDAPASAAASEATATAPQLKQLAWHAPGATELTPEAALALDERNWRHIDQGRIETRERTLIDQLVAVQGKGHLLV